MKYQLNKMFFTLAGSMIAFNLCLADGFDRSSDQNVITSKEQPVAPGSDAAFDKRLPPVLPGEIVNDSGNRMRVWSSAGPVPVSEAPEPWKKKHVPVDNIDVYVDRRDSREMKDRPIVPKKNRHKPAPPEPTTELSSDQQGLSLGDMKSR